MLHCLLRVLVLHLLPTFLLLSRSYFAPLSIVTALVSCSGFGLPMHAQLLRLFVKFYVSTITSLCNVLRSYEET